MVTLVDLNPLVPTIPARALFVRHWKLSHPYDDYDKLPFEDISSLGSGRVDPAIEPLDRATLAERFPPWLLSNVSKIVHAPSARARQTAEAIAAVTGTSPPTVADVDLGEIVFDLRELVSEVDYRNGKMDVVRAAVLRAMLTGHHCESLQQTFVRVDRVMQTHAPDDTPLSDQPRPVLFVTHGFFLRAVTLRLAFMGAARTVTSLDELKSATNYKNLEGFFVLGQ